MEPRNTRKLYFKNKNKKKKTVVLHRIAEIYHA